MSKMIMEAEREEKSKKWKRRIKGLLLIFVLFMICPRIVAKADSETTADNKTAEEKKFRIEYYQYNTCAACHPEEDFYQITQKQLADFRKKYPYEIYEYNTFHLDDEEKLEKRLQELGLEAEDYALPLVVIGDVCLSGLEEIESGIQDAFLAMVNSEEQEEIQSETVGGIASEIKEGTEPVDTETESVDAGIEQSDAGWQSELFGILEEDEKSDSVILYFSTYSCDDCSRVKELFGELEDTAVLPDGSRSAVKIHEFNIMEDDYVEMVRYLFSVYDVPSQKQQVPIVFYRDGYLSGVGEIEEQLQSRIEAGEMINDWSESPIAISLETETGQGIESAEEKSGVGSYLSLILTGFVNGLNPCGASMLLMLLAAAAVAGRSVWKIGFAYLIGKFAAYYAMGFGLYQLLGAVSQELLLSVSRGLTWAIAAVFFMLAVMYLLDFVHARRQEYDKVRMQLPGTLRKWNHDKIEKISKINGRWLIPAVAVLGVIISAGEFFCTGQVYLAAILYLMKAQEQRTVQTLAAFFVYVLAMCLPSLILIVVIEKTRNVIRASNAAVAWLPFIKLATALVFLVLAIVLLVI